MTLYLDKKIDLLLEFLRSAPDMDEVPLIARDLRDLYDSARTCPDNDHEAYRARCNKLLTSVGLALRWTALPDYKSLPPENIHGLIALEGVLLGVMNGRIVKT